MKAQELMDTAAIARAATEDYTEAVGMIDALDRNLTALHAENERLLQELAWAEAKYEELCRERGWL